MKFFEFFIILLFFDFMESYTSSLCNHVWYTGDVIDDETGETILTYSFNMIMTLDVYASAMFRCSPVQVTGVTVIYLQKNSLKFHGISYVEKYQDCDSMIGIQQAHNFNVCDQEIKFILAFIEDDEEIPDNDLCQSNKTRFVDTITLFLNDVNIFNAEIGQFFGNPYNTFTKDHAEPMDKSFLNGSKTVECLNTANDLQLPDTVEETCTNFEGNFTILNFENYDNRVGQFSYSIDSEFINFSLDSSEDWYIHILSYCLDNSTNCLIKLPTDDFQYPIQLITSFGSFHIGYIIRRLGIFLKDNYILHYDSLNGAKFLWYSEDAFTFEDPCSNNTFVNQNFNGTSENLITDSSSKKTSIILKICGSIVGLFVILFIILYFYRRKQQKRKAIEKLTSKVGTNILKNLRPDFANFLLPKISQIARDYDEFEIEWNKLIFTTSVLGAGAFGHIIQGKLINGSTKNGIYEHDFIDVAIKMPQKTASDSVCAAFLDEINLISDFGLSVQLASCDSVVVKDDAGKLPIKWLSIETLKSQEFSLNSDIWSFGVLLYEMHSFGSIPYAEIDDNSDLLQHLEAGNRLKKPMFCLDKIYKLMTKCWNSIPALRPSINELIETFKEFLEESTEGYGYLQIINE